jgi:hypothetical protein
MPRREEGTVVEPCDEGGEAPCFAHLLEDESSDETSGETSGEAAGTERTEAPTPVVSLGEDV